MKTKKYATYMILWLMIAQFFDGFLTYLGTSKFGIHYEGNPLIQDLMYDWGIALTLIAVKLFGLCCLGLLYWYNKRSGKKNQTFYLILLSILSILYVYVVTGWTLILFVL